MVASEPKRTRTTRSRYEERERRPSKREASHTAAEATIPYAYVVSDQQSVDCDAQGPPRSQLTDAGPSATIHKQPAEEEPDTLQEANTVWTPPGVQFLRETWWDTLLAFYSGVPTGGALTADMRDAATQIIFADLRTLFKTSLHWLAFVNIPRFFASLQGPHYRQAVQPSLIFGALAVSTFVQSSELEKGAKGRAMALQLLDQAHAMFDASLSAGWIDLGLVQAAWVMLSFSLARIASIAHCWCRYLSIDVCDIRDAGTPRQRSSSRAVCFRDPRLAHPESVAHYPGPDGSTDVHFLARPSSHRAYDGPGPPTL